MNIPNLLTLLRIILVPVLVIFLIDGDFSKAMIVFVIAGITDGLDGLLARILKQKTMLGAYLDPLADKALLVSSFITLSVLGIIPGWLTVIVISRDMIILFGVSLLFIMSVSFDVNPAFISKMTTLFQIITVLLVLASRSFSLFANSGVIEIFFWITAVITVVSGFHYLFRGIKFINGI
jgi:cardiolipin synthase